MLARRPLLLTAAASILLRARRAKADTMLDTLFAQFADEMLKRVPERATSLGLDVGPLAGLRGQLHEASLDALAQDKKDTAGRLALLRAIQRPGLHGLDAVSYDTVLFSLSTEDEANRAFDYGTGGARSPYVLSQLTGAYQSVPDFLDTQHPIKTLADAEDYLSRVGAFATLMDQELAVFEHDAAKGVVPPDFIIGKTLQQMGVLLATPPEKSTIVTSLVRRTAAAHLPGQWEARIVSGYKVLVLPALQRQADALRAARAHAVHGAGVARLPKGGDFYRLGLKTYTTASISPADIHKTGLDLVASLSAQIDTLLRQQGMHDGTVGQRLAAMAADKRYVYDDTDEAKEKLIEDLNGLVAVMQATTCRKSPCRSGAFPRRSRPARPAAITSAARWMARARARIT